MADKIIVKKDIHTRPVANNKKTLEAWEKIGWKPLSAKELKAEAKKAGKDIEEVKPTKQAKKQSKDKKQIEKSDTTNAE